MKSSKFQMAGWLVAAGLAGVVFAGGFQSGADKFGVVDLNKAVQDSEMGKKNKETLESMVTARKNVVEFMETQRVLTVEQATKLKNLSLKTPLTETEKKDLDKVKEDVISAAKNFDTLNQKQNPTEEDRKLLQDYQTRINSTRGLLNEWGQTFQDDLSLKQQELINDSIRRADAAIKDVCKKDGYTVVFSSPAAAVYGANDLTEAITKALNASK